MRHDSSLCSPRSRSNPQVCFTDTRSSRFQIDANCNIMLFSLSIGPRNRKWCEKGENTRFPCTGLALLSDSYKEFRMHLERNSCVRRLDGVESSHNLRELSPEAEHYCVRLEEVGHTIIQSRESIDRTLLRDGETNVSSSASDPNNISQLGG
jgi:hypothetical protein